MTINDPFIITGRLLPGLRVGDAFISIEYSPTPGKSGRVRYRYHIDLPGHQHTSDDLQSGGGGGDLQSGMESLLSFLSAAAESYAHRMRRHGTEPPNEDSNETLFPPEVVAWAHQNSDALTILELEIVDAITSGKTLIEE